MKENKNTQISEKLYTMLPVIAIIVLLAADIIIFMNNTMLGIAGIVIIVLYAVLAVILYKYYRKRNVDEKVAFAKQLYKTQDELLMNMSVPYAIISGDHILWANNMLVKMFGEYVAAGEELADIFPHLSGAIQDMKAQGKVYNHIKYEDRIYKIELRNIQDESLLPVFVRSTADDKEFYALYFYDETDLIKYKTESEGKDIVSGLMYIDNFDEIMETVDDADQSYIIALIDRKITHYIHRYDGICKKMENDKYFVILNTKSLRLMEADRFSITTSIRELSGEIHITPTVSVGLGTGADTYQDCYHYARMAIEMAISRGGDQVAIKDGVDIRYYGGKSEKATKNNLVKARVKAEGLRDLLLTTDSIFVMGHKLTDVDSLGAAVGVSCIAKSLGKKVKIIINNETISVKPLMDRFREDKEYNDHVFVDSSTALMQITPQSLIIVVDTNRPSMVECEGLFKTCKNVVVIDHHRKAKDSFKDTKLSYIESYASSASEMATELIHYISDDIKLTPIEADSMYAGIMIDTNNFLTKTGVRTFEAAAFLRRRGADVSRVRKIFRDDIDSYQAKAEAVKRAIVYKNHYAISIFPDADIPNPSIIGAQAANELLNIDSIKASFVFTAVNNKVYLSARSIDEVNVQVIAEKLGGGGHMSIAGAQFEGITAIEAKKKLTDILDEMTDKGDL